MSVALLAGLRARGTDLLAQLRARLGAGQQVEEPEAVLFVGISDAGWRATLVPADGSAPEELSEDFAPLADAPTAAADVLRRAVRSLAPGLRERVGSVRLLVTDGALMFVDNRSARIRSTDAVGIRQVGAQQLGSAGAIYGFQPFGRSSEHETPRGVYSFVTAERARDYLGAMDTLATRLVQILPAEALMIALPEEQPFAALDIRARASTLVFADPETGAVASRELPVGIASFAQAIAAATSVPLEEALQGLARRECFPAEMAAGARAGMPATATERALAPVLETLRTELRASHEYFVYQRLAGAPERLVLSGEAGRVRGLAEWVGQALELPVVAAPGLHARFMADGLRTNLLEGAPKGLLRIGKVEYRFVDGRFRPDQVQPARGPARPAGNVLRQELSLAMLRETASGLDVARLAVPALATIGFAGLLWVTLAGAGSGMAQATGALSAANADDAMLRTALARRLGAAPPDESADALFWTDKLLAIAQAMPTSMWLTKLSVAQESNATGDRRLVLEGEIPTAQTDYLGRITGLIDRLSADAGFMRAVSSVSFDGATMARDGERDVERFTVTVQLRPPSSPAAAAPAGAAGARGGSAKAS
ncbi:MAG: hypothetical protein JO209_09845 [Acidisphaera sp.]|nr:hypothetical protein [Acidisphaera sp.]